MQIFNEILPIPGWSDYYAGTDGHIYSTKLRGVQRIKGSPRKLKGGPSTTSPYLHVVLVSENGVHKTCRVHTLVAQTYLGERPEGYQTSHINGNHLDNRPQNLVYETIKQNHARKNTHGTHDRGINNSRAALTAENIRELRNLWNTRVLKTQREASLYFRVSRTTISRVLSKKRYADIV